MRKLYLFPLLFLLSACGIFPPSWDNNEHYIFAKLKTDVEGIRHLCKDGHGIQEKLVIVIDPQVKLLLNYTHYVTPSGGGYKMGLELEKLINEMIDRYSKEQMPSEFYCREKIDIISLGLGRALTAIYKRGVI